MSARRCAHRLVGGESGHQQRRVALVGRCWHAARKLVPVARGRGQEEPERKGCALAFAVKRRIMTRLRFGCGAEFAVCTSSIQAIASTTTPLTRQKDCGYH
eukprot:1926836-Pleurochrysis_carterae.AAC.2